MFGPESIPGWNVEEGAGDSATGLGSAGGGVVEPPDPLDDLEPLMEPELLGEEELVPGDEVEPGPPVPEAPE